MTPFLPVTDLELDALVDGRLSEQRRAEVEAWLREHPARAAEVERLRELNEALRGLGARVLDEPIPERLRAMLRPPGETRAEDPAAGAAPGAAGGGIPLRTRRQRRLLQVLALLPMLALG